MGEGFRKKMQTKKNRLRGAVFGWPQFAIEAMCFTSHLNQSAEGTHGPVSLLQVWPPALEA